MDHPARLILERNAGKRRGRISYKLVDRREYSPHIPTWESLLHTKLIGVGEFDNGYEILFLSTDGRCYSEDTVDGNTLYFHADSLLQFQLKAIIGRRGRPMLRPDQDSVDYMGRTLRKDSPEVYPY